MKTSEWWWDITNLAAGWSLVSPLLKSTSSTSKILAILGFEIMKLVVPIFLRLNMAEQTRSKCIISRCTLTLYTSVPLIMYTSYSCMYSLTMTTVPLFTTIMCTKSHVSSSSFSWTYISWPQLFHPSSLHLPTFSTPCILSYSHNPPSPSPTMASTLNPLRVETLSMTRRSRGCR